MAVAKAFAAPRMTSDAWILYAFLPLNNLIAGGTTSKAVIFDKLMP